MFSVALLKRAAPQNSGHKGSTSVRRSATDEQEWHAVRDSLACEVKSQPTAVLGADAPSQRQKTKALSSLERLFGVFNVKDTG
jgi:hypothetical protein